MQEHRVAANCSNTADPKRGIFVHTIPFYGDYRPEVMKQRKKWIDFVRTKRANFEPTKHSVVCSEHFKPDDYMWPLHTKTRLMKHGNWVKPGFKRVSKGFQTVSWNRVSKGFLKSFKGFQTTETGFLKGFQGVSKEFPKGFQRVSKGFLKSFKGFPKCFQRVSKYWNRVSKGFLISFQSVSKGF